MPINPATAAPFALDPKSAMDKPLAGENLLSKEDYAEQAQQNFRSARDAYTKQKNKTQKVSLIGPGTLLALSLPVARRINASLHDHHCCGMTAVVCGCWIVAGMCLSDCLTD